ncbi:MAG: NUDIX domain-containing protein [Myxococcota bacterium]
MPKNSAGILLYRHGADLQVLLVHPGGPFWARKDLGAWSVPKGEVDPGEDTLAAAKREFREELGAEIEGAFLPLTPVRQRSGKIVYAWAVAGDFDPATLRSNLFEMEWPPRSGKLATFPEVDRAAWFGIAEARQKILAAQAPLLDQLITLLA